MGPTRQGLQTEVESGATGTRYRMAQTIAKRKQKAMVEAVRVLAESAVCLERERVWLSTNRVISKIARRECMGCKALLTCAIYSAEVPNKSGTWAGITYLKTSTGSVRT